MCSCPISADISPVAINLIPRPNLTSRGGSEGLNPARIRGTPLPVEHPANTKQRALVDQFWNSAFAVLIALSFASAVHADDLPQPGICKLANSGEIQNHVLQSKPDTSGTSHVRDLDLDGDNEPDVLDWYCPGSGSLLPADLCRVSVVLSSGGHFVLEKDRLSPVLYESRVYVVAGAVDRVDGSTFLTTSIFSVSRVGFSPVCRTTRKKLDTL
jgi:hypothetical protein